MYAYHIVVHILEFVSLWDLFWSEEVRGEKEREAGIREHKMLPLLMSDNCLGLMPFFWGGKKEKERPTSSKFSNKIWVADSLQNLVCHHPFYFVSIASYFFVTNQRAFIGSEQVLHLETGMTASFG